MLRVVKRLARLLLGDYSAYQILCLAPERGSTPEVKLSSTYDIRSVGAMDIDTSPATLIREQVWYCGPGSHAYACFADGTIVGVCFYWFGERYRSRNFWPLGNGEAKLVQIVALPEMRGRGVATQLIEESGLDMARQGFDRMYARVWHSNTPSLRAFEKAGCRQIALVIEVNPFRRARPIRFTFNYSAAGKKAG